MKSWTNIGLGLIHAFSNPFRAYDFQNVVTLSSIVYGFTGLAPLAIWLLFKQIDAQIKVHFFHQNNEKYSDKVEFNLEILFFRFRQRFVSMVTLCVCSFRL